MISNEEMNDIMEIVKSLAKSGLLIIGVTERIQNPAKNKSEYLLICYHVHQVLVFLGNLLTGKNAIRVGGEVVARSQGRGRIILGK